MFLSFFTVNLTSHQQDHLAVGVTWSVPSHESMNQLLNFPLFAIWQLVLYFLFAIGHFLAPVNQLSIFARSDLLEDKTSVHKPRSPEDVNSRKHTPDLELMVIASDINFESEGPSLGKDGFFSYLVTLLQPESKGTLRLASADVRDRPISDMGWFNDKGGNDRAIMRKGLRLAGALIKELQKQGYPAKNVNLPQAMDSDNDLDRHIDRFSRTVYHYSSTCRMAPLNDPVSPGVVDDELRVHGVKGLRVADASIFPRALAAHLQAGTVMVAEKCVEMIKRSE